MFYFEGIDANPELSLRLAKNEACRSRNVTLDSSKYLFSPEISVCCEQSRRLYLYLIYPISFHLIRKLCSAL